MAYPLIFLAAFALGTSGHAVAAPCTGNECPADVTSLLQQQSAVVTGKERSDAPEVNDDNEQQEDDAVDIDEAQDQDVATDDATTKYVTDDAEDATDDAQDATDDAEDAMDMQEDASDNQGAADGSVCRRRRLWCPDTNCQRRRRFGWCSTRRRRRGGLSGAGEGDGDGDDDDDDGEDTYPINVPMEKLHCSAEKCKEKAKQLGYKVFGGPALAFKSGAHNHAYYQKGCYVHNGANVYYGDYGSNAEKMTQDFGMWNGWGFERIDACTDGNLQDDEDLDDLEDQEPGGYGGGGNKGDTVAGNTVVQTTVVQHHNHFHNSGDVKVHNGDQNTHTTNTYNGDYAVTNH